MQLQNSPLQSNSSYNNNNRATSNTIISTTIIINGQAVTHLQQQRHQQHPPHRHARTESAQWFVLPRAKAPAEMGLTFTTFRTPTSWAMMRQASAPLSSRQPYSMSHVYCPFLYSAHATE